MNDNFISTPNSKSGDVLPFASTSRIQYPSLNRTSEAIVRTNHRKTSIAKPKSKAIQSSTASLTNTTTDMMKLVEACDDGSNSTDFPALVAAADELFRQRRRIQQNKYRRQQREYISGLENGVQEVQQELKKLERQLQYAAIGISESPTLWGAVTDYFRIFRRGFRSPTDSVYTCALNVLESSMALNVRDGDVCGPRALLDRWTMFSHCFDDVQVVLQRLEKGPIENSAVATVITSFTISPNSLRLVFPHLTQENEPGSVTTSLTNKLRGQRLVVRGSAFFEWDDTIGRVTSILSESDMLTPLLQVLGNLGDVNRVFNGALVSPESIWTTRSV